MGIFISVVEEKMFMSVSESKYDRFFYLSVNYYFINHHILLYTSGWCVS